MHSKLYRKGAVRLSDKEVRELQVRLLDTIDEFCRANNIPYSLSGGTMIGAVRHKGFIPWDDDIDLFMRRDDYQRFLATFNGNYPHYETVDCVSDPGYALPFAKVMDMSTQLIEGGNKLFCYGIYVDIFPVDGKPDTEMFGEFVERYTALRKRLHKTTPLYKYTAAPVKFVKLYIRSLFNKGRGSAVKALDEYLRSYKLEGCNFGGEAGINPGLNSHLPSGLYNDFSTAEFEGRRYGCISRTHDYLSSIYGDYMTPPPLKQQKPKHRMKAYRIS